MERNDVLEKYRRFVADYNTGIDRETLCGTYNIPDDRYDDFLLFLERKGYSLTPPEIMPEAPVSHVIDYQVFGEDMQFVEIELDPGETAIAEAGAMMYMMDGIQMETIFGDGGGI